MPRIDLIAGDTPSWYFEDTENREESVGDLIVVHLSSSDYVDLIVVYLSSSDYAAWASDDVGGSLEGRTAGPTTRYEKGDFAEAADARSEGQQRPCILQFASGSRELRDVLDKLMDVG